MRPMQHARAYLLANDLEQISHENGFSLVSAFGDLATTTSIHDFMGEAA